MPERHSSGESHSSSSSSSSGSSSSSSGGSSNYHHDYDHYNNYNNNGPQSEEQQEMNFMWGIVGIVGIVIVLIVIGLSNAAKEHQATEDDANATATTQAITAKDLAEMHTALDSRLPTWKQVTDKDVHRVSYQDAGFSADSNTKEVDYGYCADGSFYVYVLENSHPGGFTLADTEGYAYTPDSSPHSCIPQDWQIEDSDDVGGNWYFVTISTTSATWIARPTYQNTGVAPTATPDGSAAF